MKKQRHDLFAADHRRQKITQYTKVLDALDGLVDWAALTKVVNECTGREASQPKGGRPPYSTQALVKIIVLQQLYGNLSDEETESALLDRGSWQRFIGMADARRLPDARTLWHFKNQLAQTGSATELFADVQRQLNAAGLADMTGVTLGKGRPCRPIPKPAFCPIRQIRCLRLSQMWPIIPNSCPGPLRPGSDRRRMWAIIR